MNLYDTNIVIDQLQNRQPFPGKISVLTLIELLRGIPEEKRRKLSSSLEELYNVETISNEIILEYCSIYTILKKEGLLIPDADLLIAATALANQCELITNDSHFKRLEKNGLKLGSNGI
mgnify:FL=1